MVIRSYNQGVEEETLEHPLKLLEKRDEFGWKETAILLAENIHERGIRIAGKRFLPLYVLILFIIMVISNLVVHNHVEPDNLFVALLASAFRLLLVAVWISSPVLIYWDCVAAERYLSQDWEMGKLNAVIAIFIGPAALFMQLFYRARKL